MLEIQFIRENRQKVIEAAKQKNITVDIDKLLTLDEKRRQLLQQVEKLRHERNETAAQMKSGTPSPELVAEGRHIKQTLSELETELEPTLKQFHQLLLEVPNLFAPDTPLGGEEANDVVEVKGEARARSTKDHQAWLEQKGLLDFERGAKVAGSKFYFSKGDLAMLELALMNYVIAKAQGHGFTLMSVPNMVNGDVINGTGFSPRGDERQIYSIEGEDLHLIATSEIPLTAYHKDEVLGETDLPLLYAGWSPSYRMEAGAYGKHAKGLYRVHQFYKVELYVFCKPEDSEEWHDKLMTIEQEILNELKIPYRKVRIAAGDLGAPAYKKFDLEYYTPVDNSYRELTSCSNVTDYQSRRLNIRYKKTNGELAYVHTLNGTAMVTSRGPIAIIENFQTENGEVAIPEVLQPYMNGKKTI